MSMNAASTELSNGLKTINHAWENLCENWKDSVSHEFETDTWEPLKAAVTAVLQGMDRLGPILIRARQDCS
jgi:hypothetical protein